MINHDDSKLTASLVATHAAAIAVKCWFDYCDTSSRRTSIDLIVYAAQVARIEQPDCPVEDLRRVVCVEVTRYLRQAAGIEQDPGVLYSLVCAEFVDTEPA